MSNSFEMERLQSIYLNAIRRFESRGRDPCHFEVFHKLALEATQAGETDVLYKLEHIANVYRVYLNDDLEVIEPFDTESPGRFAKYPFGLQAHPVGNILPAVKHISTALLRPPPPDLLWQNLYSCLKVHYDLEGLEWKTLVQRSCIVTKSPAVVSPGKDFTPRHASAVCEALGNNLVVAYKNNAAEVVCNWAGEPKAGLGALVVYNDLVLLGIQPTPIYHGRWFVVQPPKIPAGGSSSEVRPSQGSLHSSSQTLVLPQVPSSAQISTSPQETPPPARVFDRNAYRSPVVRVFDRNAYRSPVARVSDNNASQPGKESKPYTQSTLPPRVEILKVDKSRYAELESAMAGEDAFNRGYYANYLENSESDECIPCWDNEIADLLADACPRDLETHDCPLPGRCSHKHICPEWNVRGGGSCIHKNVNVHGNFLHVLPTCRRGLLGRCPKPAYGCGHGHDHVEVRQARKDFLIASNAEVKVTMVYPPQVKHQIEYI